MQLKQYAEQILPLIDLTSLNYTDDENDIATLCNSAITKFGNVAAICIYSHLIPSAIQTFNNLNRYKSLQTKNINIEPIIKIATVINFPNGSNDIELVVLEAELAINRGTNEIDLVFPYHMLINGNHDIGVQMVSRIKSICEKNKILLKVIIESGELKTPELIKLASKISIDNGADFIKTSTGKVVINATLEATNIMLNEIKLSNSKCGFKAAGGIKTTQEAIKYIDLTKNIMGDHWVNQNNFRFGASSLLNDILNIMEDKNKTINEQNTTNEY